jgi:hypothetical protein
LHQTIPKPAAGYQTAVASARLSRQQIERHEFTKAADVVAWLGAMQAQDFGAAKWALGIRLPEGTTVADVDSALSGGDVIRTHVLRSTYQLVHSSDVRWMLALVAPRLIARHAARYRQLDLDEPTFRRSRAALETALRDGDQLTREELAVVLGRAKISTAGQRLAHLLARAELDAVICSGAVRGKQATWALLAHRVPSRSDLRSREEALAELAHRYFRSRGPATVADFAWWSGLTISEARAALESVRSNLTADVICGQAYWGPGGRSASPSPLHAHLLPAFDEYLVAYKDRTAVLAPEHVQRINAGGGLLAPSIVLDGAVVGIWRAGKRRGEVDVELDFFEPHSRVHPAIGRAVARFAAFLGLSPSVLARAIPRDRTKGAPGRSKTVRRS